MRRIVPILLLLLATFTAHAQTPDPRHLKVEFEDERVRVMRLTLPPGESTGLIELNERINVAATDGRLKISLDGKDMVIMDVKAGAVRHEQAAQLSIENVGPAPYQGVITEFKGQFAKSLVPARPSESPREPSQQSASIPKSEITTPPPRAPIVTTNPAPSVQSKAPEPAIESKPAPEPTSLNPEPTRLNVEGAKMLFVNGTELAYIERGQGQPVVLVHDTLGDYRSWAPQLMALSRNYRVIAYSRRYHYPNHSNGKEHDYTYDVNATDLANFIRALNAGPVRLVGFGYGATIAGMVAAEHPELVKALVITEPAYELLLDKTMAFRSEFAREEIYGIIRKPLTKDKPEKGLQVYTDWAGYQNWAAIGAEEQYRRRQNSNALHAQTLDAAPPNFTCANAKKIAAPTLILSGQKRSPNSAEIAGVLSACVPNAERATVNNSGAAVYIDNPQEADKLLVEFLAKH